jgi:N-acetylneuraminic acid mutarotase
MNLHNKYFTLISVSLLYFIITIFATKTTSANILFDTWNNNNNFPINIASHQGFSDNNYVYVLGGGSFSHTNNVWAGLIGENGYINNWNIISHTPHTLTWHTAVNSKDKLYVIGGASDPPVYSLNSVLVADYKPGNIDNWVVLHDTPLPEALSLGGSIIKDNRIYHFGGAFYNYGHRYYTSNKVYKAELDTKGSIVSWSQINNLPMAVSDFASVLAGNKIIIVGGYSYSGSSNKIIVGTFTSNGNIEWEIHSDFPQPIRRPGIAYIGNKIYVLGGVVLSDVKDTIYYSELDSEGYPGEWVLSENKLPKAICCYPAIYNNSNLYLIGGAYTGSYYNNVYHSNIKTFSVPLLKQNDSRWGDERYDHADVWSPGRDTIAHYGCAMTSSAMLLRYYGHTDVDPSNLNTWLINNNGYLRNGSLIWAGVSSFSAREGTTGSQVEHSRPATHNNNALNSLLDEEVPPIVRLPDPQHFVVVTGIEGENDYTINDPGGEDAETLSEAEELHGDYTRIDVFRETQTDLSYLVFAVDENVNMKVYSPDNTLLEEYVETDEPLTDNDTGLVPPDNESLTLFSYPKPASGSYRVELDPEPNANSYLLDLYFFTKDGNSIKRTYSGEFAEGIKKSFIINFDNLDLQNTYIFQTEDISELTFLVNNYWKKEVIKNRGLYQSLINHLNKAEESYLSENYFLVKLFLELSINRLLIALPTHIETEERQELIDLIKTVIDNMLSDNSIMNI